jgi:hypothetical protein
MRKVYGLKPGCVHRVRDVRLGSIVLQKSKIERRRKSRKSRFLADSTTAILRCAHTKLRGRFCVKRCGPSYRRVRNASAVLKNCGRHPETTFSTLSVTLGHRDLSDGGPFYPKEQTFSSHSVMSVWQPLAAIAQRSALMRDPASEHYWGQGHPYWEPFLANSKTP